MDEDLTKCVKQILAGTASVESAQACLARLSGNDLKRMLSEPELGRLLDAYKEHNHYQSTPLIAVSEADADAGWQSVMAATTSPLKSLIPQLSRWFHTVWRDFYDLITTSTFGKLSLVAALLVLVLIPVLHQYDRPIQRAYQGEKGPFSEAPASLKYSLVNPVGKLLRPDRIITEADTLAFRVETVRQGYVSIYIAQENQLDAIASEQQLSIGTHDLNVGYALDGNKGNNTLILLFAEHPITMNDPHRQQLLIEAARNGVTSMTIEENVIYIASQQIEVH
jgi:hypothetical protein